MIERQLDIPTRDGMMTTFICHPERDVRHPVVIFFMDAAAIREELRDMARRLATAGYYVLLPNLYYRSRIMEVDPIPAPVTEEWLKCVGSYAALLTVPRIMDDTEALLDFTLKERQAQASRVGCVGYCMSGKFAINAAARFPERVVAAASFYGTELMTGDPQSPHLVARECKAELYFGWAEFDSYAPMETAIALQRDFVLRNVKAEVDVYRGAGHGFAFPERAQYHKPMAERHWERMIDLFRRQLG